MGTGKTGTNINILRHKCMNAKGLLRSLIFGPPIVVPNWKQEFIKHSTISPDRIHLLRGPRPKRVELFLENAFERLGSDRSPQPAIFITNYESLSMEDLYRLFKEWQPEVLIFDEAHYIKSYKAKRSKLAKSLALPKSGPAPFKYILTGTLVTNTPMDVFYPYLILDGGATFGDNFYAFRSRYFVDRNRHMPKQRHFPKWEPKTIKKDSFDGVGELNKRLYIHGMRVKKEECLDLPDLVQIQTLVEMLPNQKKHYEEMKKDFITFIEDTKNSVGRVAVADMAIVKALRLMQITSGFIKTATDEVVSFDETPKDAALKEYLGQLTPEHKIIVWAVWKENYGRIGRICEELGIKHVFCHGEISAKEKQESVEAFQMDPDTRVFILHPGIAGICINLVCADYSIFYSRTFSLEQSLQAEARNHRGGSEIHQKITRIDLVCEDSIDEKIVKALVSKQKISEDTLRH